jgi:hypothetical protein
MAYIGQICNIQTALLGATKSVTILSNNGLNLAYPTVSEGFLYRNC